MVPRGFARRIKGDQKHNLKISMNEVGATHHGVYDKHILCQDCDGKLGELDDYALNVCRRFPKEHSVGSDGMFEMPRTAPDAGPLRRPGRGLNRRPDPR